MRKTEYQPSSALTLNTIGIVSLVSTIVPILMKAEWYCYGTPLLIGAACLGIASLVTKQANKARKN